MPGLVQNVLIGVVYLIDLAVADEFLSDQE
jgi:hypothetical protein